VKDLLLGPPLATLGLVQERLRTVVALAVCSSDAIRRTPSCQVVHQARPSCARM
jgi:hypothetical protein